MKNQYDKQDSITQTPLIDIWPKYRIFFAEINSKTISDGQIRH